MNRIVRENYPVAKLPEELQKEFPEQSEVTLIIDGGAAKPAQMRADEEAVLAEIRRTGVRGGDFSRFKHLRRSLFASDEDVGTYIDNLRAE
jgi:hypothetical protein